MVRVASQAMRTLDGDSLEGRLVQRLRECYHRDRDELERELRAPRGRLQRALAALEHEGVVAMETVAGQTLVSLKRADIRVTGRRKRRHERRRADYRHGAPNDDPACR